MLLRHQSIQNTALVGDNFTICKLMYFQVSAAFEGQKLAEA
jgi:hypothetical protein